MKKILYEDSLAYRNPDFMKEWDYTSNEGLKPETLCCGSYKIASWICSYGHKWQARIFDRTRGVACPYCCNKKLMKGFNDFASKNPDKLMMWDNEKNKGKDPSEYLVNSKEEIWWKCEIGHEWLMTIEKVSNGRKCPYCNNKWILKGYNDLEHLYPRIAKLWDYERNAKLPSEVFPKSGHMAHWKCSKGHRWEANICSTVIADVKCPICSGKKMAKGVNDFATVAPPELLAEWNYNRNKLLPDQVTAHTTNKYWWICGKCNREWEAPIGKRVDRGDGCPFCSGKKVIRGENDLATLCPDLIEWWSEENKKQIYTYHKYSSKKVQWKCPTCEKTFVRSIVKQVIARTCPYCFGKWVTVGKNDLASQHPYLVQEWNYKRNKRGPESYRAYSNEKVWWLCPECGNEWRSIIKNRSGRGRGCAKCNKLKLYGKKENV